jgi:hypothetical protein
MVKQLPDPESIPGMVEALREAGSTITVLGNDPSMPWELKLAKLDMDIIDAVREDSGTAFGRLVEFREAMIEERFILTEDYLRNRNATIDEFEPQEETALKSGKEVAARRLRFEKYRRIFRLQEQFIARNYPLKFFVKERLKGWNHRGGNTSTKHL